MLQAILDKYINSEVSNSTIVHTNTQMRKCIIETFKAIVEDINSLIIENKETINRTDYPAQFIEEMIENYYSQQLNK